MYLNFQTPHLETSITQCKIKIGARSQIKLYVCMCVCMYVCMYDLKLKLARDFDRDL